MTSEQAPRQASEGMRTLVNNLKQRSMAYGTQGASHRAYYAAMKSEESTLLAAIADLEAERDQTIRERDQAREGLIRARDACIVNPHPGIERAYLVSNVCMCCICHQTGGAHAPDCPFAGLGEGDAHA